MNYIGRVQEYCDKNKLDYPTFSFSSEGKDHCLEWKCFLEFYESKFSCQGPSKKEAKKDCYRQLYETITKKKQPQKGNKKKLLPNIAIFVDVENLPRFCFELEEKFDVKGIRVYGFISKRQVSSINIPNFVEKVVTSCSRPNAADLRMVYDAKWICSSYDYSKVYILSKDNFANVLSEILTEDGYENEVCYCFSDFEAKL